VRYKIAKHTNYYYNRVARVICPSRFAQKWLRRHAVATPSVVIPTGGIERQFLDRAECRAKLGIRPDERILLTVGRMAREKNLETLFAMAKRVFEREPKARLWLVGDGPHFSALQTLARELGIGNRVRFVGFVSRGEVDQYYCAADAFVFASITETQGLVVQEAMLYGLPSVCVIGGGASEGIVSGENGFLVRNDSSSFAGQVVRVLNDDHLYAMISQKAIESVRGKTAQAMAESVVATYREVLGRRSKNPAAEPIKLL
jgi:glycosyltransferase involved in cell wall biosynthesis